MKKHLKLQFSFQKKIIHLFQKLAGFQKILIIG